MMQTSRKLVGQFGEGITATRRLYDLSVDGKNGPIAVQCDPHSLLDLGLPDIDGLEVTKRLRDWTSTPIIVISARGQETDKVKALDAGADDYLTKPFGTSELMARLRVALRHSQAKEKGPDAPTFATADVIVELNKRQITKAGAEVHLTPLEYKLFTTLIRHADKVVTHRQLLKGVWGPDSTEQTEYLRVFMGQLRHKLETEPARPKFLITEPGVGYRLLTQPGEPAAQA